MTVDVTLKGLTWDHPRGYAPLVNGAPEYEKQHPGVKVRWDRRTLRAFGEAPIEQYVSLYDLIIVDHPFVGFAAAHDVLIDLSPYFSAEEKARCERDSVGPSWQSYWYRGGLWALPIDAATQVACYQPDLLQQLSVAVPRTLDEVMQFGAKRRNQKKAVIVPAFPTDAISLLFTLSANLGYPIPEEADPFLETTVGHEVLRRLHELIAISHPKSIDSNPIQVYEFMVSTTEAIYCPYGFGYSNYSRVANRVRLKFSDAPAAGNYGCSGTMLGGTGVAVTRQSPHQEQAIEYAKWVTSQEHQRGTYFREGGQPASLAAWIDPSNDMAADGFFSGTLQTLQTAYLRPRFDGFVRFFEAAGIKINRCLRGQISDVSLIEWLNAKFAACRSALNAQT